jgi:FlaA1/EpsC-like NDP-sugar epimerase
VRAVAEGSKTIFTAVRFGNVLGSRGSVVPLFLQQIDSGGPVTVTDPKVTRYFMSVGEAVALVIEAASLAENGDVFMLEMGESIPILELARRMIRLRGLRIGRDIDIVFTGLRPSEKLDERLRFDYERAEPTKHPRVLRLFDGRRPWRPEQAEEIVALLRRRVGENDERAAREALFAAIERPRAALLEAVAQAKTS